MAAIYPTSLKTFTGKTNKVDLVDASHVNDLQNEVVAIEEAIGSYPRGSCTSLTERVGINIGTDGAFRKGTSFPGGPIDGQGFYRTDDDTYYIYNGASWLATQQLSNGLFSAGASPGIVSGTERNYIGKMFGTAYDTMYSTKFKKISGISIITTWGTVWEGIAEAPFFKMDIGGIIGSVQSGAATTYPTWVSVVLDVSGLINGTTYNVTAELKSGNNPGYLGSIIGIAS